MKGKLFFATKMGASKSADEAQKFAESHPENRYHDLCQFFIEKSFSPIFEWCSKDVPVVLKYNEDQLTLISVRCNQTGNYLPYEEMVDVASKFNVPVVQTLNVQFQTADELVKLIQANNVLEGCVVSFENGEKYKIKTDWYSSIGLDVHRFTKSKHNNEKWIWEQILTDKYDDVRGYVGDNAQYLDKFADDLQANIDELAEEITQKFDQLIANALEEKGLPPQKYNSAEPQIDRKQFSYKLSECEERQNYYFMYFHLYQGKSDVREAIVSAMLRSLKNNFEFSKLLAKNIDFHKYKSGNIS